MRILFFAWRPDLRRFTGLVQALTADGHEVVIAAPKGRRGRKLPQAIAETEGVRVEKYREVADPGFGDAIRLLRHTRDYAWYLLPEQAVASYNRRRAADWLVRSATGGRRGAAQAWPDPLVSVEPETAGHLAGALAQLERRIPADPGVVRFVEEQDPDVVLVTPLVRHGSLQPEAVKAARELGIPSGFLVHSWDNLSNKGLIHVAPDRVFVWNEVQRQEASTLHGIDPEHVVVTGASHWDTFFQRSPSTSREDFCRRHGFDPHHPAVLYLGSTNDVCPDEPRLVEGWLEAVRSASGPLREANVLIRRHPAETARWERWTPRHERVSLSDNPKIGGQDLYDELHHAALAVGLNTSAQIEASIVGTPVYTFSAGTLGPGQEGSLHFYYLLRDRGGVVTYARTLAEHVEQIEHGISGEPDPEPIRRFCEFFVRPHGIERPVTPILAAEIVQLAALRGRV